MAKGDKIQRKKVPGEKRFRVRGNFVLSLRTSTDPDEELVLAKSTFRKTVTAERHFEALQEALRELLTARLLTREGVIEIERTGRIALNVGNNLILHLNAEPEMLCAVCGQGVFDRPYNG